MNTKGYLKTTIQHLQDDFPSMRAVAAVSLLKHVQAGEDNGEALEVVMRLLYDSHGDIRTTAKNIICELIRRNCDVDLEAVRKALDRFVKNNRNDVCPAMQEAVGYWKEIIGVKKIRGGRAFFAGKKQLGVLSEGKPKAPNRRPGKLVRIRRSLNG